VTSRMPASVHSLANATRKPNENIDAVIRHYKAINDELEAQLACLSNTSPTLRSPNASASPPKPRAPMIDREVTGWCPRGDRADARPPFI
jgi:hypothetical protein